MIWLLLWALARGVLQGVSPWMIGTPPPSDDDIPETRTWWEYITGKDKWKSWEEKNPHIQKGYPAQNIRVRNQPQQIPFDPATNTFPDWPGQVNPLPSETYPNSGPGRAPIYPGEPDDASILPR